MKQFSSAKAMMNRMEMCMESMCMLCHANFSDVLTVRRLKSVAE